MDPDGWRLFFLILSSAACAVFALLTGVSIEESSQKELTDSGLGVSYAALSSSALTLACAVAASALFHTLIGHLALPAWAPAALLAAFWAALLALLVCAPLFIGRVKSERLRGKLAVPAFCAKVIAPLVKLVCLPARGFVRVLGGEKELTEVTEKDVMQLVDTAEENVIDRDQKEMIGNIFELDEVDCGDVAVHRTEVTAIPADASLDAIIDAATESGYSRLPVYEGTIDNIVGVCHVKDLLPFLRDGSPAPDLRAIMRAVMYVPETYKVSLLLRDFRQQKAHLAVVVDEYGGTAGIVTMEDILETIVGDIEDEYDEDDELIQLQPDGSAICDGYAEILDVFEALGVEPPEDADEDYDTIGGLVTDLLGYIPASGEEPSCLYGGLRLTALTSDERRVTSIRAEHELHALPDAGEGEKES